MYCISFYTLCSLQAISLEILALYEHPRKSLGELEKEIGMLKAQLVKKQVEIKEVNLKKSPSGGETATGKEMLQKCDTCFSTCVQCVCICSFIRYTDTSTTR